MNDTVLNIVTAEEPTTPDRLFINGDGEASVISYKTEDDIIVLSEGSSRFRPIHCSELDVKLKKRGYNLVGTRFIRRDESGSLTSELWYDTTKPDASIPGVDTVSIVQDENSQIRTLPGMIRVSGSDYPSALIQEEYNSIFGQMNTINEIQFYSSSMSTVNLIENLVELDLIRPDSDTYTSVLNLNELTYYNAKPGISCVLDITIQYSKGVNIYSRDLTIPAFHYNRADDNTPILDVTNYLTEINGDVQVEYIDKTLRVEPLHSEVDECIIYRCTATYGNL
jgi:hypothetical protein